MHRLLPNTPLKLILIVPFVMQITAAVGLTAWLSIRYSQRTVNELAQQLRNTTARQINTEVQQLLSTAYLVNDLSSKMIQRENLGLTNIQAIQDPYWDYFHTFPNIRGLGIGNEAGDIVEMFRRTKQGKTQYFLEYSSPETQGDFVSVQLDAQGHVLQSQVTQHQIDARQRPWYQAAVTATQPVWTEVDTSLSEDEAHSLMMNTAQPIYTPDGQLQGVASITLDLAPVSQILSEIQLTPSSQIYIIEPNGSLIGSSDGHAPVWVYGNKVKRLPATAAYNPLIRDSATYLEQLLTDNFQGIQQSIQLTFDRAGEKQYLQVTPLQVTPQLVWLSVIVTPEADFMTQVEVHTRNTLMLCVGALVLATGFGILTARWVTRPLLQLSQATRVLAHCSPQSPQWEAVIQLPPKDTHHRIREVHQLNESFYQMTQQLQTSFVALKTSEANFRNMAANVPGAIFRYILRPDGTDAVLYMSPGCYQLWEVQAAVVEQDARVLWEMIDPEDLQAMRVSVMHSAQTLETWYCEWRIQTPSGRRKWLQAIGHPIRQSDDSVLWHTVILDVSDRKAVEQALKVQRDFNELIAKITSRFVDLSPVDLDTEIDQALQDIGVVSQVDTSYIFRFNDTHQTFSMTHEWCQLGYPKVISQAQDIPYDQFPWSTSMLKHRETVYVPWVADLSDLNGTDQIGWKKFNVVAVLAIPLTQKSVVTGFMGFASFSRPMTWDDDIIRLLHVMGQTIANAQENAQTHVALLESEARWQFALEGAGEGVWDWNARTNEVFFSRQWKTMLGYEEDEIGNSLEEWDSRIHPEDRDQCYRDLDRHFTGQTPIYQNEHRVRCKDHSYRWILDRGKVIEWSEDGQPLRVIGTHTDITDRRQAEIQLQDLTNRLAIAAQSAQMGIWDWDINHNHLAWDRRMYELYGVKPDNFVPVFEAWEASVYPDDLPDAHEAVQQALQGKQDFNTEFRVQWPDQTVHYLEAHAMVERNEQGQPLRMIGVNWEITERKQVERQLQDLTDRFGLAIQAADMGIWEWDLVNNHLHWDAQMLKLYGIQADDFSGVYDAWCNRVHPDDLPYAKTIEAKAFAGEQDYRVEFRIVLPDHSIRYLAAFAIVQRDAAGKPVRIVGVNLDISDRKQAEEQLIYQALHDTLTDLPNRALLMNRLESAIKQSQQSNHNQFAVLFLDLDQFKIINDSLGHLIGDQLLIGIAQKLQKIIRPQDLAARLGGDEFVILLENIPDLQAAIQMAERILAEFDGTTLVNGHSVFITTSIGIVWASQDTYVTASDLMRDADIALYRAKAIGRGKYQVFDIEMRDQAMKRMTLERDLRVAIAQQEFIPYYQPIVDLALNRLIGFEALIRWQHPTRGFISPADFIPVAEETGLIMPISQWMLRAACQQVATWQQQFPDMDDLKVSVNLSGKDLFQSTLVETVQAILQETQLPATCLTLEITESLLIENIDATIQLLHQLRSVGVRISIDDFGTGYSSLSYLYNLPANYLKIDQSFVSHMQAGDKNYKIVQAVVSLSDQLEIAAIAEGIETKQQLEWLKQLGCEQGQGYLISRPLSSQAVEEVLATGRAIKFS